MRRNIFIVTLLFMSCFSFIPISNALSQTYFNISSTGTIVNTSTKVRTLLGCNLNLPSDTVLEALKPEIGIATHWGDLSLDFEDTWLLKDAASLFSEHKIYGMITDPKWHPDPIGLAKWYAEKSLEHPEITGVFLDDTMRQLKTGPPDGWSRETLNEMIRLIRTINPSLKILITYYPEYEANDQFDFDFDEVWFSISFPYQIPNVDALFEFAYTKFNGKRILTAAYPEGGWKNLAWTLDEFRTCLEKFRDYYVQGKTMGATMYIRSGENFLENNPEFLAVAKEVLNPTH